MSIPAGKDPAQRRLGRGQGFLRGAGRAACAWAGSSAAWQEMWGHVGVTVLSEVGTRWVMEARQGAPSCPGHGTGKGLVSHEGTKVLFNLCRSVLVSVLVIPAQCQDLGDVSPAQCQDPDTVSPGQCQHPDSVSPPRLVQGRHVTHCPHFSSHLGAASSSFPAQGVPTGEAGGTR